MNAQATARVYFDGLLTDPRLDHPECVAVHPDGSVWCGGEAGQIFRIADGRIEQVATTGGFCLGIAFDAAGDLYVCDLAHAAVMHVDTTTGRVERFADGADGRTFVSPNFAAFDRQGRLYVSDNGHAGEPGVGIYRFAPDGSGELWHEGPFDFANGLAVAEDDRTLYVVETWGRRITALQIGEGSAAGRSTVVELPGMLPDGLALDREGRLYIGCYEPSRVLVHDLGTGTTSTLVDDPDAHLLCHPTNVAFLGQTLLIANLGRWHLSAVDLDRPGLPLAPFRDPAAEDVAKGEGAS